MNLYDHQKGKTLDKLPKKHSFETTEYLVSTKYDGNRIFIVKKDNKISFFTSDWKQFSFPLLKNGSNELFDKLLENSFDFVIEAEFNYKSLGKLGDRPLSAILTTWRTNFNKGINYVYTSFLELDISIEAFDILTLNNGKPTTNIPYIQRLANLNSLKKPSVIQVIKPARVLGFEAIDLAKVAVKAGWEGLVCVEPNSYYTIGKRGNHIVKLKYRKTADLLCIGYEKGEGKYQGVIGALVLKDTKGRIVNVGSGLSDIDRSVSPDDYIGKIIEIEYEQIMDTYIQPTFVCVRNDKQLSD